MEHKKAHEPLLRMAKRGTALPGWKAWGIRLIGFLLSLVACALLIVSVVHISPLKVYGTIINAALGDKTSAWVTTRDAMTMLCIAVGLAPAFKMKFWNIGAEGQILVGGIATAACMIYLKALPPDKSRAFQTSGSWVFLLCQQKNPMALVKTVPDGIIQ